MSLILDGTGTISGLNAGGLPAATVTQTTLATPVAGTGPAFSAYPSGTQSISTGTYTKILFQTETFDTNNNFASSTFTPTVAGYYQVNATVYCAGLNSTYARGLIYKNGSALKAVGVQISTAGYAMQLAEVIYMNGSTDYLEVYCFLGAADTANTPYGSSFSASMVRSA